MSVRKIRNTWWIDIHFNGLRYRRKSPDSSRASATAYEAYLRNRLAKGKPIDKQAEDKKIPKFNEYSKDWLKTYVRNNNKISEQEKKESVIRIHLNPVFGKLPINKITTHKIELFKAKKFNEGYKPKSINNFLATLGKCLRCAYEDFELNERLPKIKLNKVHDIRIDYLSIEESELLLRHADGVWKDMILIALKTGLRLGELLALDWNDVNFESKIITVRRSMYKGIPGPTKTYKVRVVSMTDDVLWVLFIKRKKEGYVFTDERGEALKDHRAERNIHRICKLAGMRLFRWHTLRHTFASHLAMAGVPMRVIQDLMGHGSEKMTMRYAHLSPHTFESAINKLKINNFEDIFGHYTVNTSRKLAKIKKRKLEHDSNLRNFI